MHQRILITGAAGRIGTFLRTRMLKPGRVLRLVDVRPIEGSGERVEVDRFDINDRERLSTACEDVDAIIHLAALSTEEPWERILHTNINGTYTLLERARLAGVRRVVLASSNHAVGYAPCGKESVPDYLFPRPDTFYGVGKAAGEALGSLYHDRYGMDVLCVRIGTCTERPPDRRSLATWLSPDDCARLMEALLSTPRPGFRVVWGVSANTRAVFSTSEAQALGYYAVDDAEVYANQVEHIRPVEGNGRGPSVGSSPAGGGGPRRDREQSQVDTSCDKARATRVVRWLCLS